MRVSQDPARRTLALVAAALVSVVSCRDVTRVQPRAHAPGRYVLSPRGTVVEVPSWIPPALAAEAVAEIDSEAPPAGWQVSIRTAVWHEPGIGLVRGLARPHSRAIEVGWRLRPHEDRPLMPALRHEIDHAERPEDPCYGHGAECRGPGQ